MSAKKLSSARRHLLAGGGVLAILGLGACADYMNHYDTVTAAAGDAQAYNKVLHTTDPWPRNAANTRIGGSGERVDRVTKRYLAGPGGAAGAPATPASTSDGSSKTSGSEQSGNASGSQAKR
jgi:hypothetical protein